MQAEIRTYFEAEAKELIDRLTRGVASLGTGTGAGEAEAMADMLRAAHTLKGAAHVVGEARMATLSHEFEDGVAAYRAQASKQAAETLLRLADGLASELAGGATSAEVVHAVEAKQQGKPAGAAASVADPATRLRSQTVRVDVRDARRLLDGLSESGLRVAAITGDLGKLERLEGVGTADMRRVQRAALRASIGDELDRLAKEMVEMHRVASQLRMGSAEALLLDAGRVARATAAAQGKQVECITSGTGERVEMPILDAMADALLHLVRNAVAHGIESAAERKAAHKAAVATIRVSVTRVGTDAVFTCSDDGRGIALEPIRLKAVERGELTADEARSASAEVLLALLLLPGFSLGGEVDEVSGRGVGLDAVREAAARVRATVAIESDALPGPAQGTTFRITAPQAMFAVRAMQVQAGGRRFELPLAQVEQTFRLDPHRKGLAGRTQTLLVGRDTMPFAWLSEVFPGDTPIVPDFDYPNDRTSSTCVVLADGARRLALGVDRVLTLDDALVQPLPSFAAILPYVAGATLGPEGEPLPLLDVAALIDFVAGAGFRLRPAVAAATRKQPQLPILVIDDSLTTRMLEQSILEAEGYEVELATSAEQGLAMARARRYALFLVDVEMPGMSGYDFVALVTADAALKKTPAILVTSLDSPESRERGRAAGAYSYIVKGNFNQAVYLDRIRSVVGRAGFAAGAA